MDASGPEFQILSDLVKWTLGSIFAGLTSIGAFSFAAARWVANKALNDDTDKDGRPKGILCRMHADALSELAACTAAVSRLSPDVLQSVAEQINAKLDKLALNDESHRTEIQDIKKLVKELECRISEKFPCSHLS